MFKVGVIMQDKGDTAKAKAVYQQVVAKFPVPKVPNRRKNV
jgi:TolA-binding protein